MRQPGDRVTQKPVEAAPAEPRMAVGLLRPIVRALIAVGRDHRALLAAHGLSPASLEDPELRVPHSIALRVLDDAVRLAGDPAFALNAAEHADLADIGLLGQLLMTARSVRDSVSRTERFARLLHDAAEAWGEERDGRYHWHLRLWGVPMTIPAAEALAGSTIARMRFRLGPEWAPEAMWFAHSAPPYREAYERFFRCEIRFDMPESGTVFDASVLSLPNPVDGAIADLIERRAESVLERLDGSERLKHRVRDVLERGLARDELGAATVARALHMSRATLTRKLAAEGTSLTAVLDGLRRELALEYVRDPRLSLEELARRLAFSDARALRRAFVRWTGAAPAELRRRQRLVSDAQ